LAGLNGLNAHGQVWPCSLEIVTVPPCLRGALRSTPPDGLFAVLFVVVQALTARANPTTTAMNLVRLIVTSPFRWEP